LQLATMSRLQKLILDSNKRPHIKDIIELCLNPCKLNTLYLPIKVSLCNPEEIMELEVLIDSGVGIDLIDKLLVEIQIKKKTFKLTNRYSQ